MKIALDARLVYYQRGGIGQYILHLIQELARLDTADEYILLRSRKDRTPLAQATHFQTVPLWTPCHNRFEQITLPVELARLRFDLLHSPDFVPPWRGRFRRRFHRLITVHDLTFLYYPQFLTAESRRYYNDQIERAVRVADHISADSTATKDDLVRLLGVQPEKVSVVLLAPDPIYRPLDAAACAPVLARHKLEPGFLLFTGTLEPRKNVTGLLTAYRALCDRKPSTPSLVLAGRRGWLYDEIFSRIAALKLDDRVRFVENLPNEELVALYNAAALLVLPSFYEGFGLPCWRRWRAARRSSARSAAHCPKSPATRRCSSTPTTSTGWPPRWSARWTTSRSARNCARGDSPRSRGFRGRKRRDRRWTSTDE